MGVNRLTEHGVASSHDNRKFRSDDVCGYITCTMNRFSFTYWLLFTWLKLYK